MHAGFAGFRLLRDLRKHLLAVYSAESAKSEFAHARLEMIFPNVAILLFRRGSEILFDVLRQIDALDKLSDQHRALGIEETTIQRREDFVDERLHALSRPVVAAVFDELPDAGVPLTAEPRRRDTYLDPWYPEDATVEVWSQDGDDLSSTIELSLDANRIHCRCDSEERGAKKIFVRPEDESFAREVVLANVRSAGTPPWLGFDRVRPNGGIRPGKHARINALDGVAQKATTLRISRSMREGF